MKSEHTHGPHATTHLIQVVLGEFFTPMNMVHINGCAQEARGKQKCANAWRWMATNKPMEQHRTTECHAEHKDGVLAWWQQLFVLDEHSGQSSNYLAVVCQWISPSSVLRALNLPLLWGLVQVTLLGGGGGGETVREMHASVEVVVVSSSIQG